MFAKAGIFAIDYSAILRIPPLREGQDKKDRFLFVTKEGR